ncbi:hypothetical protein [Amycolatopsis sp. EV170708-02-1]|uniref:hypothetical protein n=1 Tax=Amycolatopsis sp. EV170708-02-1 TaxID=2919322 RepID=UPI001F0C987B|nr:hypothetical protein [Amycolatopsis sp. EV170708-02-1]UMP03409.1 hypothetical protein MJQ72_00535 [Amycolatopsis sp. EV170708-02-1]
MAVKDVYLLAMHEPYRVPEHPVPINATIVHATTLLHPSVPQPDGGRMYRCLTEFPLREPGCLVPLSTLTFELDGGRLWPVVANWERVVDAVVHIARHKGCDAMPMGLPEAMAALLAQGPTSTLTLHYPDGRQVQVGWQERERHIDELMTHIRGYVAQGGPFWPGDNLVAPPAQPPKMPYQPFSG